MKLPASVSQPKQPALPLKTVESILDDIKWGGTPEMLIQKYPWQTLNESQRKELLACTRDQPDAHQAYTLLVYLFRISRNEDLWFSVEVLNHSAQYLSMKPADRQSILRTTRNRLDRIKDEISPDQPVENLRRYWLLEATYYAINGATLAETGHKFEAIQNYQIAAGIFDQLGLYKRADQYKTIIRTLNESKPASQPTSSNDTPAAPKAPPLLEIQPDPIQPQSAPPPSPEKTAPAESFLALPDVWLEEGKLRLPGPEMIDHPESRRLIEQIQQQSEILSGIQLEIQMYLERRSILAQEVQNLEKKLKTLKEKDERVGKKSKTAG
jgi:hypothetical protein